MSRRRVLRDIEHDLVRCDPDLDDLFLSFTQLTGGEGMPTTEKIKARPLRWIARPRSRSRRCQTARTDMPGIEPFIGRWPLWWR